jgi:CMP-N-acetylneuraminic acid synthetase
MTVLGVIPARGGSKGVPGKHLRSVGGRPLLAYTADAALASRPLTRVIVRTDAPEIPEAARAHGLDVPFVRPAALAADDTPMLPVLQHALQQVAAGGAPADVLVLLQPTSPLRRAGHIDAAIEILEQSGADSVVSVVEVPHQFNPVSVMRDDHGRLVPFLDGPAPLRRQDKPRLFARNGPAVLAVRAAVVAAGSLYGEDCRPLIMAAGESLDIDTPEDLELLDYYLTRR